MLKLTNVKKIYSTKAGQTHALDGVNLQFNKSGLVFVTGASGCGKTTLLNVIGGLDSVTSGEIYIKGKKFSALSEKDYDSYRNSFIGFIFQEYNLLPEFSVRKNIEIATELQGRKVDEKRIDDVLKSVELGGLGDRNPAQLSGGQKQRVAIARALIKDPQIIMADEPTGALDSKTGIKVMETLKKLSKEKLVIVVSHDLELAERFADRIIRLKDGKVIEDITLTLSKIESNLFEDDSALIVKLGAKLSDGETLTLLKAIREKKKINLTEEVNIKTKKKTRQNFSLNENNNDLHLIPSKMKFKSAVFLGLDSLKVKPFRLLLTIFLSVIAFSIFGLFDTVASYNRTAVIANTIKDSEYSSICVSTDYRVDQYSNYSISVDKQSVAKINQKSSQNFYPIYDFSLKGEESRIVELDNKQAYNKGDAFYHNKIIGGIEIESSQIIDKKIKNFNYEIIHGNYPTLVDGDGLLQLTAGVSTYILDCIKHYYGNDMWNFRYNGEYINSYSDFIGTKINLQYGRMDYSFTITAIIDCGAIPQKFNLIKNEEEYKLDKSLLQEFSTYISSTAHKNLFLADGFSSAYLERENYTVDYYTEPSEFLVKWQKMQAEFEGSNRLYNAKDVNLDNKVLFFDDTRNDGQITLLDNELIISVADISELFTPVVLKMQIEEDKRIASESLSIIKDQHTSIQTRRQAVKDLMEATKLEPNDILVDLVKTAEKGRQQTSHKFVIAGVYFGITDKVVNNYDWYPLIATDVGMEKFDFYTGQGPYSKLISPIVKGGSFALANIMTSAEGLGVSWYQNTALDMIGEYRQMVQQLFNLFLYLSIALAIFAMFMLFNYISTSISAKRQSIGVLRGLGSSGKDVFTMFIIESLVIAVINAIFATLITGLGSILVNRYIKQIMNIPLSFATFGFRQGGLLFLTSISTAVVSSLIPIIRICKKKPVELINKF